MVGPKAGLGDHPPGQLVVGRVLRKLLPEPIDEPVAAKNDRLAHLRADKAPRQPLGEIVGKPLVGQQSDRPPIETAGGGAGFEFTNLLQRWNRAAQSQRKPAEDLQIVRAGGRMDACVVPALLEQAIHGRHCLADAGVTEGGRRFTAQERCSASRVAATGLMVRQSTGLRAAQATTTPTARMTMAGRQNALSRSFVSADNGFTPRPEG